MRLCGDGLKRGITEVFSPYGKKRAKGGGHLGKFGYYFPRRDTQTYRIFALVVVCGEIPEELIYRLTNRPSFKEILIRQLKKVGHLWVYYQNKLRGEVMLKPLCNPDRRGELYRIRSQDLNAGEPHGIIKNDAVDENGDTILFGYLLNIPRIHRFWDVFQIFKP